VDGYAKTNETVTVDDAAEMGRIVAVLHGLRIVVPAMPSGPSRRSFGEAHWLELAERGADAGAVWAERVRANIAAIMAVEGMLDRLPPPRDRIGSHRDLNAHNVLFDQDLMLIDWDAADGRRSRLSPRRRPSSPFSRPS
jgi:Ser/Thr protein kinase RdoA (MazF antagonist)